ncbi:MAG: 30S ribosomal protein S7 [Candidatus Omnitrophica bacterium]|nr:30S ribosomal protein S7 [Candidatus Omnitrophota bacterium]
MRRKSKSKKELLPDPKYKSRVVTKFINMLMHEGKKSVAERILYGSLEILQKKTNEDAIKALNKSIENARPRLEVKPRRVGGATYQVPIEVNQARGTALALRWIRDFARSKKGRTMQLRLAEELFSAYKGEGATIKKRDDTHKMAEANKAFAHFRW